VSIFGLLLPNPIGAYNTTLNVMAKGLQKRVDKGLAIFVNSVKDRLVDGIRSGSFSVPPLTEAYRKEKSSWTGVDSTGGLVGLPVLMRSGGYVNAIKAIHDKLGWRIGFKQSDKNERQTSYDDIAKWLEFGTSRMVARPHWRPTAEYARQNVPSVGRAVMSTIRVAR